jgi:hypothetical protein
MSLSLPLQLGLPVFQPMATMPPEAVHLELVDQISDEFGLFEAKDVFGRISSKTNSMFHEQHRNAVNDHAKAAAQWLKSHLELLKGFGMTPEQICEAGRATLPVIEASSCQMIADFESFQSGARSLQAAYTQFDTRIATPVTALTPLPNLTFGQNLGSSSLLANALSQYRIAPSNEQAPVLDAVVARVNSLIDHSAETNIIKEMLSTSNPKPVPIAKTTCQRPPFSKAVAVFVKVKMIDELAEEVGGKLKQNFEGKVFINGCAARISHVLKETGCKIPVIPKQTVSGQKGDQYIYRLAALEQFLRKAYGPPECVWRDGTPVGENAEKCSDLSGRKGILIERWAPGLYTSCTGHATLINGEGMERFPPLFDGNFWELPDDD